MPQSNPNCRVPLGFTPSIATRIPAAILVVVVLFATAPSAHADDEAAIKKPDTVAADAASKPESKSNVVLLGRLSRAAAMADEPVRFSLVVENDSEAPLKNISIEHLEAAGFKLARRCWSADSSSKECASVNGTPPAMADSCKPSGDKLCDELPAHQSLTVWGDLLPVDGAPNQQAFAVVRWSANGFDSRGIAQLGPLESRGFIRGHWLWLTQDWDLGIPFWLTVFGGLFALWQARRDRKEQAKAEQRKDTDRKEAEKREVLQQTWDLMLPLSNQMSLGHYIPMATATLSATIYLQVCRSVQNPTDQQLLASLFSIAQMHWQRLRIKRRYGGCLFKSRTAESLVELLFQKHLDHFKMGVNHVDRYIVLTKFLKGFHYRYELVDFEADRKNWDASQQEFWEHFKKEWPTSKDCTDDLIALGAMQKLLTYEANRPFLNWYKEQIPVKLTAEERTLLISLPTGQLLDESATTERVSTYLDEIAAGVNF